MSSHVVSYPRIQFAWPIRGFFISDTMPKPRVDNNPEPVFGEVPELEGVWATGSTVEECRRELISVIEGWIALRLRMGDSIPPIGRFTINVSTEPMAVV